MRQRRRPRAPPTPAPPTSGHSRSSPFATPLPRRRTKRKLRRRRGPTPQTRDFGDADDQDHPPQDAQDDPPRDDQDDPPQGKDIGRFRRQGLPCRALVNRQGDMFVLSSNVFVNNIVSHILDTRRPFLTAEGLHNETDRLTKDSQMQIKAILCRKSRVWQPFLAATQEQLRRSSK